MHLLNVDKTLLSAGLTLEKKKKYEITTQSKLLLPILFCTLWQIDSHVKMLLNQHPLIVPVSSKESATVGGTAVHRHNRNCMTRQLAINR